MFSRSLPLVVAISMFGLVPPAARNERMDATAVAPVPSGPVHPASASYDQPVAAAIRNAALHDAQASYWRMVAVCLNETGANLSECLDDAYDDFIDAYLEAQAQYDARIDIGALLLGTGPWDPVIEPSMFSSNVTNPFFPLTPGTTMIYQKTIAEGVEQLEMTVLPAVTDVNGVGCRTVHAVETLDGVVIEDTIDWFAQKSDGSVWYLGEIAQNFEDGFLDNLDGSWRYGKDDAKPGIVMLATPAVPAAYRQEFQVGEAEDIAEIVAVGLTVTVPAGTFTGCLRTREISPLSPGDVEFKDYAPGVGLIREFDPGSGESLELTQIIVN